MKNEEDNLRQEWALILICWDQWMILTMIRIRLENSEIDGEVVFFGGEGGWERLHKS